MSRSDCPSCGAQQPKSTSTTSTLEDGHVAQRLSVVRSPAAKERQHDEHIAANSVRFPLNECVDL